MFLIFFKAPGFLKLPSVIKLGKRKGVQKAEITVPKLLTWRMNKKKQPEENRRGTSGQIKQFNTKNWEININKETWKPRSKVKLRN
jgi:hypothetical protein